MDSDRVYEPVLQKFGRVVKSKGILGLKDSMAIIFDDGKKKAYFGKGLGGVLYVSGGSEEIPVDLVTIWKSLLKEDHAATLVESFVKLGFEEQEVVRTKWASTTKRSRVKFAL